MTTMPDTDARARRATAATLDLAELLHWERAELDAWEAFFLRHPRALDFPFAPADGVGSRMATVRGVVHHIVAVERRYADRLVGAAVTAYEAIPAQPVEALFAAARDANARVAAWVSGATDDDLGRMLEFETISAGVQRGTARKIAAHALLHGVRTWAQVATVVRLNGAASGWQHDLLCSDALA